MDEISRPSIEEDAHAMGAALPSTRLATGGTMGLGIGLLAVLVLPMVGMLLMFAVSDNQ